MVECLCFIDYLVPGAEGLLCIPALLTWYNCSINCRNISLASTLNFFLQYFVATVEHRLLLATVIWLSLGRPSVNLLPVAQRSQRTNALTYGVVERTWAAGREFESHVHHENAF